MQAFGMEREVNVHKREYNVHIIYITTHDETSHCFFKLKTMHPVIMHIIYLVCQCFNFTYFQVTWFRITFKNTSDNYSPYTKILQVSNNFPQGFPLKRSRSSNIFYRHIYPTQPTPKIRTAVGENTVSLNGGRKWN